MVIDQGFPGFAIKRLKVALYATYEDIVESLDNIHLEASLAEIADKLRLNVRPFCRVRQQA